MTTRPQEERPEGSPLPASQVPAGEPWRRVGFACLWERDPARTWSSTPWALRDELARRLPVVDLGAEPGRLMRAVLRSTAARRTSSGWTTLWRSSALTDRVVEHVLEREVKRQRPGVALQVLDLAHLSCPYFVLRDTSWAQVRKLYASGLSFEMLGHPGFTAARLDRRWARERSIIDDAVGVIATSEWMRDGLVDEGVPAQQVHVVGLGATSAPILDERLSTVIAARLDRARSRLLFVGRDFHRKAGDLVVEAFAILRARRPDVTLTIVGPPRWPLEGPVPPGVDFRGALGHDAVGELYATHDLFVMPSRFEAFGMVFVEAQSAGLPCVARDRCAMPELVIEGVNGTLQTSENAGELAERIENVLDDDELYRKCAANVPAVREQYAWSAAASKIEPLLQPFLR